MEGLSTALDASISADFVKQVANILQGAGLIFRVNRTT